MGGSLLTGQTHATEENILELWCFNSQLRYGHDSSVPPESARISDDDVELDLSMPAPELTPRKWKKLDMWLESRVLDVPFDEGSILTIFEAVVGEFIVRRLYRADKLLRIEGRKNEPITEAGNCRRCQEQRA